MTRETEDTTIFNLISDRLNTHEERVEARFAGLDDKVDNVSKVLTEHVATEDEDRMYLRKLGEVVWGNGKPGHNIRIDRLEQQHAMLRWFITGIFVPIGLYAAYAVIHWGFKLL
jgi:hypothetical protein